MRPVASRQASRLAAGAHMRSGGGSASVAACLPPPATTAIRLRSRGSRPMAPSMVPPLEGEGQPHTRASVARARCPAQRSFAESAGQRRPRSWRRPSPRTCPCRAGARSLAVFLRRCRGACRRSVPATRSPACRPGCPVRDARPGLRACRARSGRASSYRIGNGIVLRLAGGPGQGCRGLHAVAGTGADGIGGVSEQGQCRRAVTAPSSIMRDLTRVRDIAADGVGQESVRALPGSASGSGDDVDGGRRFCHWDDEVLEGVGGAGFEGGGDCHGCPDRGGGGGHGDVTLVEPNVAPGVRGNCQPVVLDEPVGTRIAGATAGTVDRLALQLQGGGPDRVVLIDTRSRAARSATSAWRANGAPEADICLRRPAPPAAALSPGGKQVGEATWEEVRYCSDACRTGRRDAASSRVGGGSGDAGETAALDLGGEASYSTAYSRANRRSGLPVPFV